MLYSKKVLVLFVTERIKTDRCTKAAQKPSAI